MDASMQVWGSLRVSIRFIKSVESWMKDGSALILGCSQ